MVLPSRRLLALAGLVAAAGIGASALTAGVLWWPAAATLLGVVALIDLLGARRAPRPAASRQAPTSFALGVEREIGLAIVNPGRRVLEIEAYDHHPAAFQAHGLPLRVRLPAGAVAELSYGARPVARGSHAFGLLELRIASPLGLWQRTLRAAEELPVRVYPNFAAIAGYALLATDHRLSRIGVLQRQRRGEGLEFHQLREYREGDVQRQIDWKATARTMKLISREYQDERDQTVMLLLDCGRRMSAKDGELAHFDHVLNAALLLAYASLRQGDAVGLMTMSGPLRWLAPRKSAATVNLILNHVYDLEPTGLTSDYYSAAVQFMKRARKRALVVILSNLRDEDDDTLGPALALLQSRHLVLFASLREEILSRALVTRVDSLDRALTHAATADYLRQRELAFKHMERGGALCLDVEPGRLPIALVNRYLEIKRARRL
jgi:uncharacterized protein (DUF58 family)